jgi:hypothetical protein
MSIVWIDSNEPTWRKAVTRIFLVAFATLCLVGCDELEEDLDSLFGGGGTLGDDCTTSSCADGYICQPCSGGDVCYFDDIEPDPDYICRTYSSGEPGAAAGNGGGGSIVGTWVTDPSPSCNNQISRRTFNSSGTGRIHTPECTGAYPGCTLSNTWIDYSWSVSGSSLSLAYGTSSTCGESGYYDHSETKSFSISGDTLTLDGTPWYRE